MTERRREKGDDTHCTYIHLRFDMSQTISVIYAMSCANPEKNKIFFLVVVVYIIPQMN